MPHKRAPTHQLSTVRGQPPQCHLTCTWDSQENSFRYKYSYKSQAFRGKQEKGGAPSSSLPPCQTSLLLPSSLGVQGRHR